MTVKRRAIAGPTTFQMQCDCGLPCSSSRGGPEPPWRRRMLPPGTSTLVSVKPSKNIPVPLADAIEGEDVEPDSGLTPARVRGKGRAQQRRGGARGGIHADQRQDDAVRGGDAVVELPDRIGLLGDRQPQLVRRLV